jgi:hypothetical protein
MKSEKIPKCSCGNVSEYHWDPCGEEWYVSKCWRCLEIQWMKDPENGLLKSMLPWDTSMIDRFIEIVMDDTLLTKTVKVTRYKGKNR